MDKIENLFYDKISKQNFNEFIKWLPQNIDDVELLHKFDRSTVLKRIKSAFNS